MRCAVGAAILALLAMIVCLHASHIKSEGVQQVHIEHLLPESSVSFQHQIFSWTFCDVSFPGTSAKHMYFLSTVTLCNLCIEL